VRKNQVGNARSARVFYFCLPVLRLRNQTMLEKRRIEGQEKDMEEFKKQFKLNLN